MYVGTGVVVVLKCVSRDVKDSSRFDDSDGCFIRNSGGCCLTVKIAYTLLQQFGFTEINAMVIFD